MTENTLARTNVDAELWGLENDVIREQNLRHDRAAFGAKLIKIRALMQQKNGTGNKGKPGADGLQPLGWIDWCKNNGIPKNVAAAAVRAACGKQMRTARRMHRSYTLYDQLRLSWPHYTDAEKGRFATFVRERALEERTHVVG